MEKAKEAVLQWFELKDSLLRIHQPEFCYVKNLTVFTNVLYQRSQLYFHIQGCLFQILFGGDFPVSVK